MRQADSPRRARNNTAVRTATRPSVMRTPGNCFRMGSNFSVVYASMRRCYRVARSTTQYTPRDPCLSWRAWLDSARPFAGLLWPVSGSGEVAEWLKAPHSKCGILARVSGVRIPPSPPTAFPEQLAAWLDSVANDPVAYRQISLNGSELMAVYFTVLVIEAWPRKCCKRRVSMPFAARA